MITTFKKSGLLWFTVLVVTLITSCKKDNFDEPPATTTDPNLTTTHSIAQLRALFTGGLPYTITDDVVIKGTVIADDKTGNFYETLIIDDGTGAIPILINQGDLYTQFPIGRKIYVNCKNLVLGVYGNYLQMGGFIDNSDGQPEVGKIDPSLVDKIITKGPMVTPVAPIKVHIADLDNSYQARLIQLDTVEFAPSDANKPYANIITQQSLNRTLLDCDGYDIIVRTSNFATFSNTNTPNGNGTVIGIYSIYNSDKQLLLRTASEVNLVNNKCDGSSPNDIFHVNEDFEAVSTSGNLSIDGWVNWYSEGTKKWVGRLFDSNKYAQMNAYSPSASSQEASNVAWLITPVFNLTTTVDDTLTFETNDGFDNGAILEVLYSTNYSGSGDPTTATWTALTGYALSTGHSSGYGSSYVPSGAVSLNAINAATVSIAFRYTGGYSPSIRTTTFQLDNVKVKGQVP